MSGIELLFSASIEYERTHQLALFTLLRRSHLAETLLGIPDNPTILWEPRSQLFDLAVITPQKKF